MPPVAKAPSVPPTPPKAASAPPPPPGPARPVLQEVTLTAPMVRLPGNPYCQRRLDLTLNATESQALRDLYDGLTIGGKFGDKTAGPQDAIRWLLNRAAIESGKVAP